MTPGLAQQIAAGGVVDGMVSAPWPWGRGGAQADGPVGMSGNGDDARSEEPGQLNGGRAHRADSPATRRLSPAVTRAARCLFWGAYRVVIHLRVVPSRHGRVR